MGLGLFTKRKSAVSTTPAYQPANEESLREYATKSAGWLNMTLKQLAMLGYTSTNALTP
jgi:hypothetical protein